MFFEESEGINEVTDIITQYVRFCENLSIPSKTITVYPNNKPWVNKELKELLQNKQRAKRFNKICHPSQRPRWQVLAYRESNNVHLLITGPPEICVNLVFKHIHAASSYTICRQFVPFIYCPL